MTKKERIQFKVRNLLFSNITTLINVLIVLCFIFRCISLIFVITMDFYYSYGDSLITIIQTKTYVISSILLFIIITAYYIVFYRSRNDIYFFNNIKKIFVFFSIISILNEVINLIAIVVDKNQDNDLKILFIYGCFINLVIIIVFSVIVIFLYKKTIVSFFTGDIYLSTGFKILINLLYLCIIISAILKISIEFKTENFYDVFAFIAFIIKVIIYFCIYYYYHKLSIIYNKSLFME